MLSSSEKKKKSFLRRVFQSCALPLSLAMPLLLTSSAKGPPNKFEQLTASTCLAHSEENKLSTVVVFTGGEGRVPTALYFYTQTQNANSFLYISGVDRKVTVSDVLRVNGYEFLNPQVNTHIFNDNAETTNANAIQTAMFLKEHCIDNVTFVTSDYHMPRARFVLDRALNNINYHPNMSYVTIEAPPLTSHERFEEDVKYWAVKKFHALGFE